MLQVARSGRWIGGEVVGQAEALAASWFSCSGAAGTASGTDALMLALQAVGVRPGDEVIVPAFSFFATAGAVAGVGASPVLVDVLDDGTLDPAAAARARTERTAAVVPVHLFGNPAAAPDLGVPIVDDAAQAVGLGSLAVRGSLAAVSTYPTKTWAAAGDGGFVVGNDSELLARVRALGHHGHDGQAHQRVHHATGRNCRLDAVQAAVLLAQRTALPRRIAHRRRLAQHYDSGLPSSLTPLPRHPDSPVAQYCVRVHGHSRAAVRAHLGEAGIETRVYYGRALPDEPALGRHLAPYPTPVADALARSILALPVHRGVADADADRVLAALHEVCP